MKIQLVKGVLGSFIENNEFYINGKVILVRKSLKEYAFLKWVAYLLVRGSDKAKYGAFKMVLDSQFYLD